MALINSTFLQQSSGVIRWLDENGGSVKTTSLSDTSVNCFAWDADGDYFYTSSIYSTGRQEKWARDGTTYTWQRTGIDNITDIAVNSNGDLACIRQDDVYLLGASDGATDYSDVGSSFQYYTATNVAIDSSDNVYVFAADLYFYMYGLKCFKFDSTLTLLSSPQLLTGSFTTKSVAIDSSGNLFVVADNGVLYKFNSSGTQQWSYHPHPSGAGYGNVNDVRIANSGKIYGCHSGNGSYVFRLTDNGSSSTEDWSVEHSSTGAPKLITVTSDQVICHTSSGSFDTFAVNESNGALDTGFSTYDTTGVVIEAHNDPLVTVTCGAFAVTEEIKYSRWVLTGGTISDCGPFETTAQNTIRGFGDKLIDKLFSSGHYVSGSPRYDYFVLNGDPPTEEKIIDYPSGFTTSSFLQPYHLLEIDDDGNIYNINYKSYTAEEADTASDGYYTSAGSYYSIRKLDPDGTEIWNSKIIIGTVAKITMDLAQEYIFALTGYTSGAITKWSCSTGVEVTGTYLPIDFLDASDTTETKTFKIGRDGYLYCGMNDASDSSIPKVFKWNLDGSTATNWSTPYPVPQHAFDTGLNDLDVNASGTVALGCVKISDAGDAIKVVGSNKVLSWEGALPSGENAYGSTSILIDDTGDVYTFANDGADYKIRKVTGETSGIVDTDWVVTENYTTGAGYFAEYPFFSREGNQDYFYTRGLANVGDPNPWMKYDSSDGSIEWRYDGDLVTLNSFCGIARSQVAAWGITVTYGTNGTVQTYWGGNQDSDVGGTIITSGDIVYAEAGADYKFVFVGDSNGTDYYVDTVTIDGTSIGYAPDYTFTNVSYRHTVHVTFGTGFPSGPFTTSYEMFGGILDTITCGSLSESYALRDPVLRWFIHSGPLQETLAITGEGYLPFDISLLYLINAHRSDNAVASVVEDPRGWLLDGAEYAVADMIANGSLTKTLVQIMGQDGANYPYLYAGGLPTIADVSFTPQDIFDAWILDGPTEAMILNSNYEEIGIYVEEYLGDNYIFVLFAQWHPQYTVVRLTEKVTVEHTMPNVPWFNFLTAENHELFLQNSVSVHLPKYAAKVGDYELPNIYSFTYRLELDKPSYLLVNAQFSKTIFEQIELNKDEGISVESIIPYNGVEVRNEVVNVEFAEISYIAGETPKIEISGYRSLYYYESTINLRNVMTRVKDEKGKTRFRCSQPDFYIRPGCTVSWSSYSIVAESVVIFVQSGINQYMEITGE